MEYVPLAIPGVVLIKPKVFGDERGFFMGTFRQSDFAQHCGHYHFVLDNHSKSAHGILRGLRYQLRQPQGKLVRVTRGEVFDVAVDLRQSSPIFGQWVGEFLSEENKHQLWVPPGFTHGFLVTSLEAEFFYKCTDNYAPDDEYGLIWNDSDIAIDWPELANRPILSGKHQQAASFADCAQFS